MEKEEKHWGPVEDIKVKCYSGHTYAERPTSFAWEDMDYEVEEIEKAWREPGERHFAVRTSENKLFHLCYNDFHKRWRLIAPGRR